MPVSGMCLACGLEQEDVSHMIFQCSHGVHLWQAMREVWDIPKTDNLMGQRENWLEELLL
jgi:hypothetical protein